MEFSDCTNTLHRKNNGISAAGTTLTLSVEVPETRLESLLIKQPHRYFTAGYLNVIRILTGV
jgi:hypothetical protein